MAGWLARLAVAFLALVAAAFAGGTMLGAASAETHVTELIVTCLSCSERWPFVPSESVGAGLLSLFRRRALADICPKCGSRTVAFAHADEAGESHGRTA